MLCHGGVGSLSTPSVMNSRPRRSSTTPWSRQRSRAKRVQIRMAVAGDVVRADEQRFDVEGVAVVVDE
jgi:hypothetical protein